MKNNSDTCSIEIIATIQAMRNQEETAYQTEKYIQTNTNVFSAKYKRTEPIDPDCRTKMSQWCFKVVDFCKFNRETVAIAMSYLDRYLATNLGQCALTDRRDFQLVAMTCLYTAIKIHEPEAVTPGMMARLSRNNYIARDFEECEVALLGAIEWRVNPPTALAFIRHALELIPLSMISEKERVHLMELVTLQLEAAVNDYSFIGKKASTTALAAIINALASIGHRMARKVVKILAEAFGVESDNIELVEVKAILASVMDRSRYARTSCRLPSKQRTPSRSVHTSPRSITTQ